MNRQKSISKLLMGVEVDCYQDYSKQELIQRIRSLESSIRSLEQSSPSKSSSQTITQLFQKPNSSGTPDGSSISSAIPPSKKTKNSSRSSSSSFNFKKFYTRKVALKISYDGYHHCGFAWQPEITRLTTVESEIFRALLISRLVECHNPSNLSAEKLQEDLQGTQDLWRDLVNLQAWEYSRAGRTDAGVSGSGQIVSLWVRSALNEFTIEDQIDPINGFRRPTQQEVDQTGSSSPSSKSYTNQHNSNSGELKYDRLLNSILPSSIRVLGWSGVSEDFDARFSCLSRHYKYFFQLHESTQSSMRPLNVKKMREASQSLVGEHDFRNLCKLDPSKQIQNFNRTIISASISPVINRPILATERNSSFKLSTEQEVTIFGDVGGDCLDCLDDERNEIYVFDLVGTAFLYNMVRHIVSILFLIGSELESPDLISRLLYTDQTSKEPILNHTEGEKVKIEAIERKPKYNYSNPLPLTLHSCNYPEGTFRWQQSHGDVALRPTVLNEMFGSWSRSRIKTMISLNHLRSLNETSQDIKRTEKNFRNNCEEMKIFDEVLLGAAESRLCKKNYVKVLNRERLEHYQISNSKWMKRIGTRRLENRLKSEKS
ncbi:pseudouridine synthase [Phakopsora pachyrhizi]|uniref:Pseudouridine synthase n=1 Tax=Phakopsora pachyrhizi TaxID=170000 RepID=A0AAV0AU73_PHAPC|nr:pseudouridine synthase [Phakopsora pachyrhizi]